ncbi:MAG: DUF1638 domain-containing protein [Candidatus Methanomethylophilus sp.]|nr:DUF1638 domain-containing protein [Methanomethylophilus sp.]MDD4222041.1 DUF1638 domain-containing protein [Methanomethylophilus sp.]
MFFPGRKEGLCMKLGIIACDVLKNEIEYLTKCNPHFVYREYLEFAMHEYPDEMRNTIIDRINAIVGQVDAVFLGYARCDSLDDIDKAVKVPTVKIAGSDCIEALLGPKEYYAEKKKCAGTWFSSPGWSEQGVNGLIKEFHLDCMEGYDPQFFLDVLFQSYERCLFIDPGIGNTAEYRQESEDVAKTLKLKHDCRTCGLDNLKAAIAATEELGRQADLRRMHCAQ